MKVTVFVPIELEVKEEEVQTQVCCQLRLINQIIDMSELESEPNFLVDLVSDSEIVVNEE